MGLGAFDVDDLLAVDLTERVERRTRAKGQKGTVTTASRRPKTTIGTSATISVRIRLFTSLTLDEPI